MGFRGWQALKARGFILAGAISARLRGELQLQDWESAKFRAKHCVGKGLGGCISRFAFFETGSSGWPTGSSGWPTGSSGRPAGESHGRPRKSRI